MTGAAPAALTPEPLLAVVGLRIARPAIDAATGRRQWIPLVDGVSFSIASGETLGLVGESGCGKSLTALAVPGLLPAPLRATGGAISFRGEDLLRSTAPRLRQLRGRDIGIVFQEPSLALDPVRTVGSQIGESLRFHRGLSRRAARERAVALLEALGVPEPARRVREYPHELSGGMQQRALIASAVAASPALLIADEPTSALDATVRQQILALLRTLQRKANLATLFISHDLGVVSALAQRVAVMYCGRIVEEAPVAELFASPRHPYTEGLLRAVPRLDATGAPAARVRAIEGTVPPAGSLPKGCAFAPRCERVLSRCHEERPATTTLPDGSRLACFLDPRVPVDSPDAPGAEAHGGHGAHGADGAHGAQGAKGE